MKKPLALTIAIPAFNEENNLAESVTSALKEASKLTTDFEILVVNDGSTDGTLRILEKLAKAHKQLKIINHPKNLGIEASLKNLYQEANKEVTFFNGADNEIKMSVLPKLLQKLEEGNDIVVAQRKLKKYNIFRAIISWSFNFLIKSFFGFDPYDAGCAKLFKTKIYKGIKVKSASVFGEAERLIKASKMGYKISSVKVTHYPNKKPSSIKLMTPVLALKDFFRILINS